MMQQRCIHSVQTGVGTATGCGTSFARLAVVDVVLAIGIVGELAGQVIDYLLEEKLREIGAQEEQEHPVGEIALGDHRAQVGLVYFAWLGPVERPTAEGNSVQETKVASGSNG